jgi:hypothetical protein
MCACRWLNPVNVRRQTSQENGLSPVCSDMYLQMARIGELPSPNVTRKRHSSGVGSDVSLQMARITELPLGNVTRKRPFSGERSDIYLQMARLRERPSPSATKNGLPPVWVLM